MYYENGNKFEIAAKKEGFERFTSIYGQSGWKKDGKFYTWCGSCNTNQNGYAVRRLGLDPTILSS